MVPSVCIGLLYCPSAEDSGAEATAGVIEEIGSGATPMVLVFDMITGGMWKLSNGQRQ
jgi:hypothetical protein